MVIYIIFAHTSLYVMVRPASGKNMRFRLTRKNQTPHTSSVLLYLAYLFSNADLLEIISKIPVAISGVKLL